MPGHVHSEKLQFSLNCGLPSRYYTNLIPVETRMVSMDIRTFTVPATQIMPLKQNTRIFYMFPTVSYRLQVVRLIEWSLVYGPG